MNCLELYESFSKDIIKNVKDGNTKDSLKKSLEYSPEIVLNLIRSQNTYPGVEMDVYPIYKDKISDNIIGYDIMFIYRRKEFVANVNGKNVLEKDGEKNNYLYFCFMLPSSGSSEYSLSQGTIGYMYKIKNYSIPNTYTKDIQPKKYGLYTLKKLSTLSDEERKHIFDIYDKEFKRYKQTFLDNMKKYDLFISIYEGFILNTNLYRYFKDCYKYYIDMLNLENTEIDLYKKLDELFEKKNITIK